MAPRGKARARSRAGSKAPPALAGVNRVFVHNLVLPCFIGIHPHERELAQRVRLNVDLTVAEGGGAKDDIAAVVSYEEIVFGVKRIIGEGHINLVETLAERVAGLCFADPRVRLARVQVEKLDVFPDAESVGVMIERTAPGRSRRR